MATIFQNLKKGIKELDKSYDLLSCYQDSKTTLSYNILKDSDFEDEEINIIYDKVKTIYPNLDLRVVNFKKNILITICREENQSYHQFGILKKNYKGICETGFLDSCFYKQDV